MMPRVHACGSADGAAMLVPGSSGFLELVFCTAVGGRAWTHSFVDIPSSAFGTFAAASAKHDFMWAGAVQGELVVIVCIPDDGTGCGRGTAMTSRIQPLLEVKQGFQPISCVHVDAVRGHGGMIIFTSDAGVVYLYDLFGELGDPRRLRALGRVALPSRAVGCFVSETVALFSLASSKNARDGIGRLATADQLITAAAQDPAGLPDLTPPGWASDCTGELIRDGTDATFITLVVVGDRVAAYHRRIDTMHNMFGTPQPPRVRNMIVPVCTRLKSRAVAASWQPGRGVLCLCTDGRVVSMLDDGAVSSSLLLPPASSALGSGSASTSSRGVRCKNGARTVAKGVQALTSSGFMVTEQSFAFQHDLTPSSIMDMPADDDSAPASVCLTATPLDAMLADYGLGGSADELSNLMYIDTLELLDQSLNEPHR